MIGVEVLFRIVRDRLEGELVQRQHLVRQDADGVAVVGRLGAGAAGDVHAAAGAVLDHDRLAEPLLQLVAERAHEDVAGAAGAVGGDDADRLARIGLCVGDAAISDCSGTIAKRFIAVSVIGHGRAYPVERSKSQLAVEPLDSVNPARISGHRSATSRGNDPSSHQFSFSSRLRVARRRSCPCRRPGMSRSRISLIARGLSEVSGGASLP